MCAILGRGARRRQGPPQAVGAKAVGFGVDGGERRKIRAPASVGAAAWEARPATRAGF